MQTVNVSFVGTLLVVLLVAAMLGLFSLVDRRLFHRMVRVLLYFAGSMALVGIYAWVVLWLHRWWVAVLGAIFILLLTSYLTVLKSRLPMSRFFLPVFLAQALGMSMVVGCMLLSATVPTVPAITALAGMAAGELILSTSQALKTYVGSLRHTSEHYMYLLANGATHFEAIMPSVRRSLRMSVLHLLQRFASPLFVAPPVFFCTLVYGGASAVMAAVLACELAFLVVAACFFSAMLLLVLIDRSMFDPSGRLLI